MKKLSKQEALYCNRCIRKAWLVMRITLFLLVMLLPAQAKTKAQKVNLKLGTTTLVDVFSEIEKQTELRFIYNNEVLSEAEKVYVNVTNEEVEEVLKSVLTNHRLSYKFIDDKVIIFTERKDVNTSPVVQQSIIRGKVIDIHGEPLPGVNVYEKSNPQNGVITGIDGTYTIEVSSADALLVFSFIGFDTQETQIAGRSEINITLSEEATDLGEVVVVGYGTQKKVNLTGAVSSVKMTELEDNNAVNLSNTLAGRAPGVNVTNTSGLSGASSSIRMRGSFGEPLYVIDGVISNKDAFDALDAEEIDQLSFLKDAATGAIYGSKAGNGVVLVKTKTGSKQKPMFQFKSSYGTSRTTQELFSDMFTATDELIYQNRVAAFEGRTLPNGDDEFAYFKNGGYNVNDFIWQNPSNVKSTLSVNGGSDKIQYYAFVGYTGEEGSYKNLDSDRFNLRSNVTAEISNAISVGLNLSAKQQNHDRFYWPFQSDDDNNAADLYRATFNWPKLYPFYTLEDGTPVNYVTDFPVRTPMGAWSAWSVIDQVIGDRYIKTRERQLNSILTLNIDLGKYIKGLSTKVVGSYNATDFMRKKYLTFQKNYTFIPADPDGNRFLPDAPDPDQYAIFNFSQAQPFLSYDINTQWNYQFNWYLNYNRQFGNHGIDAVMVFEQAENGGYGAFGKGEDPIMNYDQMYVYSSDSERRYGTGWEYTGARQSLIGRANYNYNDKYIAEFSFRYDGNTLFPESGRWGFFPSTSLAWRISQEGFMEKSSNWLDDLKLRLSYGTTGNDLDVWGNRITPFSYAEKYVNSGSYIFGNNTYRTIRLGATPNPNLTWTTNTSYNVGVDFAVLNSRLSGNVDVFLRKATDILGPRTVTLPDTYGRSLAPENYAARSWRGGELFLKWSDGAWDNQLKYTIYGNMGYAKDQWDTYDEGASYEEGGNLHWASRIGQPVNRLIGFKAKGIVRTQEQLDALNAAGFKQFGRSPYLGAILYEDFRGDNYSDGADGKVDWNDRDILSTNAAPRINYGFGFNLEWKGISLDAHFQGVTAYDRMISNKEGAGIRQWGGNARPYYPIWTDDVWTPENEDAKYPRVIGKNWAESGAIGSTFWMRNGAYLRLKNLNIAYNLPEKWMDYIGLNQASVFVNGTNLFVISEMTEFHDPEQQNYDSYPLMKTYTVGLSVNF